MIMTKERISSRNASRARSWPAHLLGAGWLSACGAPAGEGDVEFTVWGEEYIEEGIPRSAFEDGAAVTFDEFLIVISDVEVAGGDGPAQSIDEARLYDLVAPGPHVIGTLGGLRAGSHRQVSYRNPVAGERTRAHASATKQQLEFMRAGGYALYAAGRAETRAGETYRFRWGFTERVDYTHCVDVRGGQQIEGLVVADGTLAQHQVTIHGDHLFYDDLASPEALLRFTALAAADADDDGEVTLHELDRVPLASLSNQDGAYGVGSFDIDDLGAFVRAAALSVGHYDGEGHCVARAR